MQFVNEEILHAPAFSEAISEKIGDSRLALFAAKGPFFDSAEYVANFQKSLVKRYKKRIRVESFDLTVASIHSIRKLIQLIPSFGSIQLVYDGTTPFSMSILPAAVISRFFGKEAVLLYYPDRTKEKIPRLHRKVMSLFNNVYVGARYLQRELAVQKVTSRVLLPPISLDSFPERAINKVQPHILLKQNDNSHSGIACAMRAAALVKQKYPRTELSVLIENVENWLENESDAGVFIQPFDCTFSNVSEKFHEDFAKADVFINCSLSETAPLALLTAMSSGLPSISFETYGAREIIEHGVNGLLIRHNDHNQLANEIIRLIEEPLLAGQISREAVKIRARLSTDNFARPVS